jgi:hypothetical protein
MIKNTGKISVLILLCAVMLLLSSCSYGEPAESTGEQTHVHRVLHWETVTEASCKSAGMRFGTCVDCLNEVRDEPKALGHIYRNKVCERCGDSAESMKNGEECLLYTEYTDGFNKKGYTLVSAYGFDETELVIPATYNGYPVVKIDEGVFRDMYFLEKVVIPDSVLYIGQCAFENCGNLREVKMSANLKEIGYGAFAYCKNLERMEFPDTLTKIGENCFIGCTGLKSVKAGGCVEIGDSAFENCEMLYEFYFPQTLKTIGNSAFRSSGLMNANLPDSLMDLGVYAFTSSAIKTIRIPPNLRNPSTAVCSGCTSLETAVVETSMIRNEFQGCDNLKTIIFTASVNSINQDAIAVCYGLETVYISSETKYINEIFFDCPMLSKIVYSGTLEQWLATSRKIFWHFFTPEALLVCTDKTLTREDLHKLEMIE